MRQNYIDCKGRGRDAHTWCHAHGFAWACEALRFDTEEAMESVTFKPSPAPTPLKYIFRQLVSQTPSDENHRAYE